MKAVSAKELKQELATRKPNELMDLCLRLARFKKENKELLTYLLFESSDEASYVESVKFEIDEQFDLVNKKTPYLIKKSIRKILQNTKKYIRYSLKKETEVELLIYFCTKLKNFRPSMNRNVRLQNMFIKQIEMISNKIKLLHEDLQYDFKYELSRLTN
jgi:hypothetical protein